MMTYDSATRTVIRRGWNHFGCGPWIMIRRIPKGWRLVKRGKSRATDRCISPTDAGARKAQDVPTRNGHLDTYVPSKWEPVSAENVGVEAKEFRSLIRKTAEVQKA